jgi:hypothetical protein
MDFFTKVIIIRGWSNWISTQSINICMSEPWSMYYFEIEVLQHVNPPTFPTMCI